MKTKILGGCVCLLLVLALVLGWQYMSVRTERDFLQRNIDGQFSYNLSLLFTNLFQREGILSNEETLTSTQVNAQLCKSLFTSTSYAQNMALQNIMLSLAGMVPPNAEYQLITDKTLIDDIGGLMMHLNYPETAELSESIWARLSAALQAH